MLNRSFAVMTRYLIHVNNKKILIVASLHFQFVTSVPTHKLPRNLSWGSGTAEEIERMEEALDEVPEDGTDQDVGRRGQILWVRGLTRLQHQVKHAYCTRSPLVRPCVCVVWML
jgi:hypothetical protein